MAFNIHPTDLTNASPVLCSAQNAVRDTQLGAPITESLAHKIPQLSFEWFLEASKWVDIAKKFTVMSYPFSLIQIFHTAL